MSPSYTIMECIGKRFKKHGFEFGCGQCMPCRINSQCMWTGRILLEAALHPANSFVTLTYDDEHLPKGGVLVKKDVWLWQKRLRYFREARTTRFVTVGEYGDDSSRPHYHAAVFGTDDPELIAKSWKLGFTDVRGLGPESARYIVSYLLKRNNSVERCDGKPPEFKIQSNRPGIGMEAIKRLRLPPGEVPTALRLAGNLYPLGRYLVNALRERQGETEDDVAFRHRLAKYTLQQRDPQTHQEAVENAKRKAASIKERRKESPGL